MTELATFSFDVFLSLSGSELVNYAEPYVNTDTESISSDEYVPMVSELTSMDETHLVYALEICMRLNPKEFIHRAVDFLTHPDDAVCITAFRIIESVPLNEIPTSVVNRLSSLEVVKLFGPDLHSGERICVGTNETLLRNLLEKFGCRL